MKKMITGLIRFYQKQSFQTASSMLPVLSDLFAVRIGGI